MGKKSDKKGVKIIPVEGYNVGFVPDEEGRVVSGILAVRVPGKKTQNFELSPHDAEVLLRMLRSYLRRVDPPERDGDYIIRKDWEKP